MPPFARASDLDRILRCTGSLSLLRLKGPDKTERSSTLVAAADWGTDMHTVKETGEVPPSRANDKAFVAKAEILKRERQTLYPDGVGRHEVSFAYDVVAGKVKSASFADRAEQDAWKQAQPESCIVGTADWVGDFMGEWHVDDLKTGRQEPEPRSYQNMFYGLCVAILEKAGNVLLSSTHFPRYPVKGEPVRLWAPDGHFEAHVEAFRAALAEAYLVYTRSSRPRYVTGPYQCAYCPVKEKCPV